MQLAAARSTILVCQARDAADEHLAKVVADKPVFKEFFLPDILLQAEESADNLEVINLDVYRTQDDNLYSSSSEITSKFPDDDQDTKLIIVRSLEYLLMQFISPYATKVAYQWLQKLLLLCHEEENVCLYATLNMNAISDMSPSPRSINNLKSLFQRVVTLEPPSTLELNLRALQYTPFDTFWNDVIGYERVKHELERLVRWHWHRLDDIQRMGISPSPGLLFVGPSGCGKTFFAKKLGQEQGITLIEVKASDIYSKWYGDSEKAVRDIFKEARAKRPCILLMDEVESIAPERSSQSSASLSSGVGVRVLSTLLNELDGVDTDNKGLVVIGVTSRMESVDKALIRPGRLGSVVHFDLPNDEERYQLLKYFWKNAALADDIDFKAIVQWTSRFSVAGIQTLCKSAAYKALWDNQDTIHLKHVRDALR